MNTFSGLSVKHHSESLESFQFDWVHELQGPQFSWSKESLISSMQVHGVWCFIDQDHQPLDSAFLILSNLSAGIAEILTCAVAPELRNRGIMRRLIAEALIQSQATEVWLEVHEGNVAAQKLYLSLGFTQTGLRKHYYSDKGHALLMTYKKNLCF